MSTLAGDRTSEHPVALRLGPFDQSPRQGQVTDQEVAAQAAQTRFEAALSHAQSGRGKEAIAEFRAGFELVGCDSCFAEEVRSVFRIMWCALQRYVHAHEAQVPVDSPEAKRLARLEKVVFVSHGVMGHQLCHSDKCVLTLFAIDELGRVLVEC